MLALGDHALSLELPDAATGESVTDRWREGPVVLAFFKTTCPVCQMAAPKVQALAEAGVRRRGGRGPAPGDPGVRRSSWSEGHDAERAGSIPRLGRLRDRHRPDTLP